MSIYWNEGRKDLEDFTKNCKIAINDNNSPFNTIKATPELEHLLRTNVALSFLRGKLKYAYLILRKRFRE